MKKVKTSLKLHPWRIFTYLSILGISSAFLTLLSSFFFTVIENNILQFNLPSIFHANTALILISSYSMYQTKNKIGTGQHQEFRFHLMVTTGVGILFMVLQIVGWNEMISRGISFSTNLGGTYIYLISGLHMLHLLVGVVWLGFLTYLNSLKQSDPLMLLLYETNPMEVLKVELASTYWHFIDALWLVVYLFLNAIAYFR